eukprot:TRINITY_DN2709_c4_g2_i1.p1 TRINITY_DN2709_c4_g2~~TRINITY_DN2709_c4_g2_i1.p1  ORF type:complete len:379 (+),score=61.85 TRINITY_DN2709_c4_g2_i1:48-1139(+)
MPEDTVGFTGNTRGGQGEIKKTLRGDESVGAWHAFIDEIKSVRRLFKQVTVKPDWLAVALRVGEAQEKPPPEEPVQLYVSVGTKINRVKGVGKTLPCEIFFHLPRGYPAVPPVEQGEGDIEINMTGLLSKHSMRVLAREVHLKVISIYEQFNSSASYPQYIVDVLKWAELCDFPEVVASQCIPKRPKTIKERVWIRFHHIESQIKSGYGLLWGKDLGIRGYIGRGQPGFVVVEGFSAEIDVWVEKYTAVLHWGPVPCELLLRCAVSGDDKELPPLALLSTCVTPSGAFNGRDSIGFPLLVASLREKQHFGASSELESLLPAFHHENGHVDADATSTAINTAKELNKAKPAPKKNKAKAKKRLQ